MKMAIIVITLLIMIICAYFFVLGKASKSGSAEGLKNGELLKCPDKINCVCSEKKGDIDHFIRPIIISDNTAGDKLKILKEIVKELGGKIQRDTETYISSTFSSSLFGFVDDLEIRVDSNKNVIHLRSASRVGYSDLGANRKRVKIIKKMFFERTING